MNGSGFFSYSYALIVLLFIIALAYYSIRWLGVRGQKALHNPLIRQVAALSLGQNKTLQVVVVDEKTVLILGVCASIEPIAQLDDADLARRLLLDQEKRMTQTKLTVSVERLVQGVAKHLQHKERQGNEPDFADLLKRHLSTVKDRRTEAAEEFSKDIEKQGKDELHDDP